MNLSPARLQKQVTRLHRLFPALAEVSIELTSLQGAPFEAISEVIAGAWQRTYGDRIRIDYSPEFLQYCTGSNPSSGIVLTAYAGGQVQGVVLGFPVDLQYQHREISSVLTTGLCVTEAWEHGGLLELLMVQYGLALNDRGITCAFHWRSAKDTNVRSAGKRLAQASLVRLFAKALHVRRAGLHAKMSRWEQWGLLAFTTFYAVTQGRTRLPASYQFRPFEAQDADAGAAFLKEIAPEGNLTLPVSSEQLLWNCTYAEGDIRASGWIVIREGRVCALAWGYCNPVPGGDAYFLLDRVAFLPSFDLSAQRAFITQVENAIREQFDCFAVLLLESVCSAPLEKMGYHSVKTYHFGASDMGVDPPLTASDLIGLPLSLR
ncbi:MAG: hypothetical protein KAH38_00930 [Candidatus Hydrogenedentes bacterium]|nr:hypothetical protein [Candidatus Hydrogenedentota bacterium]